MLCSDEPTVCFSREEPLHSSRGNCDSLESSHCLCHAKSGVGRPANSTKNRGRPPGETTNTIIAHIRESAAPSVAMSVDTARICSSQVNPSHLTCAMCQCIADAPVALACGPLACCKCLIELLPSATHCPGCNTDLSSNHIEKCTDIMMEVLINSKAECIKCHQPVPLRDVVQHKTACVDGVAQLRHTAHDVTLPLFKVHCLQMKRLHAHVLSNVP